MDLENCVTKQLSETFGGSARPLGAGWNSGLFLWSFVKSNDGCRDEV